MGNLSAIIRGGDSEEGRLPYIEICYGKVSRKAEDNLPVGVLQPEIEDLPGQDPFYRDPESHAPKAVLRGFTGYKALLRRTLGSTYTDNGILSEVYSAGSSSESESWEGSINTAMMRALVWVSEWDYVDERITFVGPTKVPAPEEEDPRDNKSFSSRRMVIDDEEVTVIRLDADAPDLRVVK